MDYLDVKQKNFYHFNDMDNNFHAFNLLPVADLQVVGLRVTTTLAMNISSNFCRSKQVWLNIN